MRVLAIVAVVMLSAAVVGAQEPASPGVRLGWEQVDADAPTLRYDLSVDGVRQALASVACAPLTLPSHDCEAPLPTLTQGTHTLTLRSVRTVDGVEFASGESDALEIVFAERPSTPGPIVIILGP